MSRYLSPLLFSFSTNWQFAGLNLADASIFIECAMILATFDISKAVENGVTIEPSGEYTTGTVR